jgi:hypothetical protein
MLATGAALAAIPASVLPAAALGARDPIYTAIEAHRRATEREDDAFEERVVLLETVPTTAAGLAALLDYIWHSEVGGYMVAGADEMAIFIRSMHCAACLLAGLPAPGKPTPGNLAAMARRSRENARENARRDALQAEREQA